MSVNLPLLSAGILMSLGFIAHVTAGNKETLETSPPKPPGGDHTAARVERNWVQAVCAFQLVSVDLLLLGIGMILLATTDWIAPKRPVAWALAAYLALWGIAWVAQLALLKRAARDYGLLPQWTLFFACAGLAAWGALAG